MRIPSPASYGSFAIRFAPFDAAWALVSPALALWIRGVPVLPPTDWLAATSYCLIAFLASLVAFLVFRIREGMTHLFSVHDALGVAKAVLLAELTTCLVLFSMTRLDGIPRSTPLIHALLLAAGLVCVRAYVRMSSANRDVVLAPKKAAAEYIILIGANKLSALYISFLRAYAPKRYSIIAVLDDRPEMANRSIMGVRVLGPCSHLLPIIEDFKEHGIRTDRVIVGGAPEMLAEETLSNVSCICSDRAITLDFVPRLVGLDELQEHTIESETPAAEAPSVDLDPPRYFQVKRYIDFCLSALLLVVLLPLVLLLAAVVLLDVGSPVFFWQRRIGLNGQSFHMYKFRTLKPAYDESGQAIGERVSWVGSLLRRLRLDELPQLLNVLVGDMSLIGPRPLLPHDQPSNPTLRLMARPGITGWAQVNGGKLLTPEEKNARDEWYVRNASLGLDLKIIWLTVLFILRGEGGTQLAEEQTPIDGLEINHQRRPAA